VEGEGAERGIGGLLRSLLAGIPWRELAEGTETLRFPAPRGEVLRLQNTNGRTRVLGEDRSDVEVRAAMTARAESSEAARRMLSQIRIVGHEVEGALELEVEVPRKWNRRGYANLELHVPRATHLEISNPNGKVCIEGVRGKVQVRSSNGSVRVEEVEGDVDISTSNAKICCSGNEGRLLARSCNGKIEIDEHRGSIDASTSNATVRAALERLGKQGVYLATSNGRVVLDLPEAVDADVDLWVDNGTIRNDRELDSASRDTDGRVLGRLGHGGALVKLRTSNGSISLR
jgi:DUF4097 and DUF4098 domain-containing protein YvlB